MIIAGFTQKQIVSRPLCGGEGIVCETTGNDEALEYARRIVEHCQWNGIIHFDFKMDSRDGKRKLLEVNPKFWTNVGLSMKAGVNFSEYAVRQAAGESVKFEQDYLQGLVCHWPLLELQTFFETPFRLSSVLKRIYEFASRFRNTQCNYDINPVDIEPAFNKMREFFAFLLKKVKSKFRFKKVMNS